jgi:hypothetical protein
VIAADGTVVLDGSGTSVLSLAGGLAPGAYTWEVSGTSSVSFTLRVAYTAP